MPTKPSSPAPAVVRGDHDRVVMASRRADGTPDQTTDFEFVGDKEVTLAATKRQLTEQAVSASDVAANPPEATAAGEPDPTVAPVVEEHRRIAADAEKAATQEVEERFAKPKGGERNVATPGGETR